MIFNNAQEIGTFFLDSIESISFLWQCLSTWFLINQRSQVNLFNNVMYPLANIVFHHFDYARDLFSLSLSPSLSLYVYIYIYVLVNYLNETINITRTVCVRERIHQLKRIHKLL